MALSVSPALLVGLLFLLAVTLKGSAAGAAEVVPDQWREFEVPVVPEDKVRAHNS